MAENRRVRMTKKLMKDALLELLDERPIGKITVTDVCEHADVNRSTFYSYYADVSMLLKEIENDVFEQIPVSPDLPTIYSQDVYLDMLEEFFKYVRENERLFRILIIRSDNSDFNSRLIAAIIEKYHRHSLIDDTMLSRYGYIYCINGVIGLLKEWISGGFPISARSFSKIVLRMSINANDLQGIDLQEGN